MRRAGKDLGKATSAELRDVGNEVRDRVRNSTEPPYASSPEDDSEGAPGRKRRTVKTSARLTGVSLYSLQPDAGVWNWGGTIKPRGVPIVIPKTEFVSKEVEHSTEHVAERLGLLLDGIAARYAEFV